MVPKDREGRFQTGLFDRYQRSEKALMLSLVEMYMHGVSTRKVKAITEELCGLDILKSQVSRLAKDLDEDIQAWWRIWGFCPALRTSGARVRSRKGALSCRRAKE